MAVAPARSTLGARCRRLRPGVARKGAPAVPRPAVRRSWPDDDFGSPARSREQDFPAGRDSDVTRLERPGRPIEEAAGVSEGRGTTVTTSCINYASGRNGTSSSGTRSNADPWINPPRLLTGFRLFAPSRSSCCTLVGLLGQSGTRLAGLRLHGGRLLLHPVRSSARVVLAPGLRRPAPVAGSGASPGCRSGASSSSPPPGRGVRGRHGGPSPRPYAMLTDRNILALPPVQFLEFPAGP